MKLMMKSFFALIGCVLIGAVLVFWIGSEVLVGNADIPAPEPDPHLLTEDIRIVVGDASIDARLYQKPGVTPTAAVLWMHGGGFISGSMNMPEGDAVARAFAHAGLLVLNLDYRLVPPDCEAEEWNGEPAVRYPTPIRDGQAGFRRLLVEAITRGVPEDRIFVGGASAGGNLAVNTVAWNNRDGLPATAGLVLAYPLVHGRPNDRAEVGSWLSKLVADRAIKRASECFVGSKDPDLVSLIFTNPAELRHFPPVIMITGEADPLRPWGEAFADDLRDAGVDVVIEPEPGTAHGHLNEPALDAFDKTMNSFNRWIERQVIHNSP